MGGLSPELEGTVFPKGREGRESSDAMPFILDEKERETIYREAGRQEALSVAQRTARGEAQVAARLAVDAALGERKSQLNAFKSFLGSIEELVKGSSGEAKAPAGRTEVVLKLHRLVDNGGPRPSLIFQKQWVYDATDALELGDPDFEGRTMAWAKETGRFGRFQWRVMGWADGENTLDTTYSVTVEQPEGYTAPAMPKTPELDLAPLTPPDPLASLRDGLGIVAEVQKVLGGGAKGSGEAAERIARMTGEMEGRQKAEEKHEARLRELEERHRKELDDRERTAYKRGFEEGDRKARWELDDRIRELNWKLREDKEPDVLDKIVSFAGGPEGVSSLVAAVTGALNRRNAAAQQGRIPRPGAPAAPRPALPPVIPPAAQPKQAPAAAAAPGYEPTRAEHLEAMEAISEALGLLEAYEEENPGQNPHVGKSIELLSQVADSGRAEGPLAAWWASWTETFKPMVDHILTTAETPEPEEEPMSEPAVLKDLLIRRLDEGTPDEAIIAEAKAVLTAEQQAEWFPMLKAFPKIFLGRMLGAPQHQERLVRLVESLTA
ncbi:MAG: hypothetical protein JST05_01185 [Acidobacteria bacterium]|nr:hypothetical protein [Acidobacteriota bacterium]